MRDNLSQPVNIYGAGGHSRVVESTLRSAQFEIGARLDDNAELVDRSASTGNQADRFLPGIGILGADHFPHYDTAFVLAIGNNQVRSHLAGKLPVEYVAAIHASAVVTGDSQIGAGSVVFAGAVIQPGVAVGQHAIVNTRASIDHDCRIGDFVHVSPGATICGDVRIGPGTHVGAGAVIIQGVKVGQWATIGAGAVVIRDVPDFTTVVGCPARSIKRNA